MNEAGPFVASYREKVRKVREEREVREGRKENDPGSLSHSSFGRHCPWNAEMIHLDRKNYVIKSM